MGMALSYSASITGSALLLRGLGRRSWLRAFSTIDPRWIEKLLPFRRQNDATPLRLHSVDMLEKALDGPLCFLDGRAGSDEFLAQRGDDLLDFLVHFALREQRVHAWILRTFPHSQRDIPGARDNAQSEHQYLPKAHATARA